MKECKRGDITLRRVRRIPGDEVGRILLATASRPMTARQLSEMLNIPIVNCYRKIKLLESLGLLNRFATLYSPRGKAVALYSSQLRDARIYYSDNRLKMALKVPPGVLTRQSHSPK
ncbi:MAG: hypothetical protein ACE5KV_09575 [Thermoplasmata archaeon]